jgi:Bacterial SH3 domain
MFGKIIAGTLMLAVVFSGAAWVSTQLFVTQETPQPSRATQGQEIFFFDYTVTGEPDHVRVSGTANFPNGVILVGTLDRVGSGPVDVKEALVMNRRFVMEFGPELYLQYYLHTPQNALQAGVYRLSVEFDPAHQSPFAQESLQRSPLARASLEPGHSVREVDPAIIRLSRTFAIGSPEEQQEAQTREQQYRQAIRQRLSDTLGTLIGLWQGLRAQYQQERLRGGFAQADSRAMEWQTWSSKWLNDLQEMAEKARLYESISLASPHYTAWDALVTMHKHLAGLRELYFEVLMNERSPMDPELQRADQAIQYAFGDASAQLGLPSMAPPPPKVERVRAVVTITSPLVNVRSGPGMSYESISQLKKDAVLDFLDEQGEWFQVQLSGGRTGWVYRNVASKHSQGDGTTNDVKQVEGKPFPPEKRPQLQLEPVRLLSAPVEYVPHPTSDEIKIYGELEPLLRDLPSRHPEDRKVVEQGILQRMSDKYGISPEQIWNTYLKVQGWEIKQ